MAMIQLSPEEAEIYKDCPVVVDFSSGFYIFPVSSNLEDMLRVSDTKGPRPA